MSAAATQQEPEAIMCHCGRPIHYSDEGYQEFMMRNIKAYGDYINIEDDQGRIWKVQRHFAFLHPSRVTKYSDFTTLGFEEVIIGRGYRPARDAQY